MAIRLVISVRPRKVLPIVHGKVEMVEGMVRRAVDDIFERVPRDHIRVMDLKKESNYGAMSFCR